MTKNDVDYRKKYNPEQIQFILKGRLTHAMEYRDLAKAFQKKFGGSRTPEQMRHAFRNYVNTAVIDDDGHIEAHPFESFTHSDFEGIHRAAKVERGRWFITAASPISVRSTVKKRKKHDIGQNVYMPGFKSVQTWLKAKDHAELVIVPMRAHMPPLTGQPSYYDPRLQEFSECFANEFHFNENLRAIDAHLNPQQVHPLTGLHRIRGGKPQIIVNGEVVPTRFHQSLIFGHAKQDKEPIATGNGTSPRDLYSTGAITMPEYLSNRMGRIAAEGHILGGLIVEVDGDDFWVRQVQFAPDGSFCDIDGMRYRPDGRVTPVKAKALRIGDLHGGREDKVVLDAQVRLADSIEPEEVYIEDVLDGASVSHHTEKRRLTRALRPPVFKSIEAELEYDRKLVARLHEKFDRAKIVIVASNHHDHFIQYLEEGRYHKDDPNWAIAHRMIVEILDTVDPEVPFDQQEVDYLMPLRKRVDPEGIYEWLGPETDRYVDGVQMGAHGHLGVDGARGSAQDLEKTFGDAMLGHLHYARIVGRLYIVGHSSHPRHGYNRGPSRWSTTPGIVWPQGQKQLVNIVNGRYCLDDQIVT